MLSLDLAQGDILCQNAKAVRTLCRAQRHWHSRSRLTACSLHRGIVATSSRDHGSARAFIKFGQLNSPSWGKWMPLVLHSKSFCGAHSRAEHSWGHFLKAQNQSTWQCGSQCIFLSWGCRWRVILAWWQWGYYIHETHLSAIYRGNRNKTQQVTCSQQDAQASQCLPALREISQKEGSLACLTFPFICLILNQLAPECYSFFVLLTGF